MSAEPVADPIEEAIPSTEELADKILAGAYLREGAGAWFDGSSQAQIRGDLVFALEGANQLVKSRSRGDNLRRAIDLFSSFSNREQIAIVRYLDTHFGLGIVGDAT